VRSLARTAVVGHRESALLPPQERGRAVFAINVAEEPLGLGVSLDEAVEGAFDGREAQ